MSIIRQPLKPSSQVLSNRESLLVARKPFLNCVGPSTNQYRGDRSVDLKKAIIEEADRRWELETGCQALGSSGRQSREKEPAPFFQLLGPWRSPGH